MDADRLSETVISTSPVASAEFGEAEIEALERVIRSGTYLSGPETRMLEVEFSHTLVRGWATVATSSGVAALRIGLRALGIGAGDEVIVPAFAPVGPANTIQQAGARVVFADIDPSTLTISAEAAQAAITPRTRAIMAFHMLGQPSQLDDLSAIAVSHGLHLIEEATHAPGATFMGREVGTWGSLALFSLGHSSPLSAGAGAMAVCSSAELARRMRALQNHAREEFSPRMSEFTAAVARAQLIRLPRATDSRRMNATLLNQELRGVSRIQPFVGADPAWREFVVRAPGDRDEVARALRADWGIETSVPIAIPCNHQPAFAAASRGADLPATERAAAEVLGLPIHPGLGIDELQRIADAVVFLLG